MRDLPNRSVSWSNNALVENGIAVTAQGNTTKGSVRFLTKYENPLAKRMGDQRRAKRLPQQYGRFLN